MKDKSQGKLGPARVIISRGRIARRVGRLAAEIADRYDGLELTVLAVLTGSLIFLGDLIRRLPGRMRLDVVSICSYPGKATKAWKAKYRLPIPRGLRGKHVLVVDDILDSGQTLGRLLKDAAAQGPASLRSCVLLRKNRRDLPERLRPEFVGFDVPDEFLVGYGLDYDNLYRNLPDVCALGRPRARAKRKPLSLEGIGQGKGVLEVAPARKAIGDLAESPSPPLSAGPLPSRERGPRRIRP